MSHFAAFVPGDAPSPRPSPHPPPPRSVLPVDNPLSTFNALLTSSPLSDGETRTRCEAASVTNGKSFCNSWLENGETVFVKQKLKHWTQARSAGLTKEQVLFGSVSIFLQKISLWNCGSEDGFVLPVLMLLNVSFAAPI